MQLRGEDIEAIITLFSKIEPEKFIMRELDCVASLISYTHRGTTVANLATQLFFDIAVQNRPYPKELVEVAIDKLISTIRIVIDSSLRLHYIQKAYETLS